MTRKQKILRMIERLPEDVSYERVAYDLSILQDIEIGLEQAARGEGIDHDELFDRLEAELEKAQSNMDASGDKSSGRGSRVHRKGSATDGGKVRKAPSRARRQA
jgi:hypothetical protein